MTNPAVRPADRYGDLRPAWHSTLARVLVVTLAVLGLAWVAYAGWQAGNKPVRWTDVGYIVLNDSTTQATFDVTIHDGTTATCLVQALAADFSIVGQTEVPIRAEQGHTVRQQVTLLTQQPAVTAIVKSCKVP